MKRPELTLEGKAALITGATGGIGGAIAETFGAAGAALFLGGTNAERLSRVAGTFAAQGIRCGWKAIDLTAPGAGQALVDAALGELGRIDILVNSAGINRPQQSVEVTEANWDEVLDINLKATFFVCQAAGKVMIARGGGKIVNISSQAGLVALPLRAAYCSSKGGVNHLTRTLALEWAKHRILVNAVAPTFVLTPFTRGMLADEAFRKYVLESIPLGRMAEAEDVAHAALFLASDLSSMTTGHVLTVDGGWTLR